MRQSLIILFVVAFCGQVAAQKFTAEKSYVKFYSEAPIENISAENSKASSLFNAETHDIVFVIPIADFEFAKSLMKEHFNEKYMDSEKYPRATFQGKISAIDVKSRDEQKATATGKMTIHGVTKDVVISGTVVPGGGDKLVMKSKFIVKLADYNIDIPKLVIKNIAEQVEVTVEFTYRPQ